MNRFLSCLLTAAMLLGLTACAAGNEDAPTTLPSETEEIHTIQSEPAVTVAPTQPTEPPAEGSLFLTVSQLTFSVVGESENIYVGTADPALVTWEIADPSVVSVENGVATALSVGTTTVAAVFNNQRLECTIGCLANTQEELAAMDEEILRSPKRLPPVVETPPLEFFDDATIIGDSISYILFQYETMHGHLGNPLFLARGGCSLNGFVRYYKNIYYQGHEMKLEDAVAASGVTKALIMLGNNDLGYRTIDETMESWDLLLGRIREQSPDITIFLQSCIPEWTSLDSSNEKNAIIQEYNALLREYAKENNCLFLDMWPYAEDHIGRMATVYSMDNSIHMNEAGCIMWMQALNAYAQLYLIGGNLE